MLIIPELNLIFIHILKTGGQSISRNILQHYDETILEGNMDYLSYNPITKQKTEHAHYTAKQIKEISGDFYNQAFKFLFVRNPWDRYVSFYFYGFRKLQPVPFKNFEEFINYVVGNVEIKNEASWANAKIKQIDFLNAGVDFIGRFENLQKDFNFIAKKFNIPVKLPHINTSTHKNYRSYYNSETKSLVAKYCKYEIKKFGYSF